MRNSAMLLILVFGLFAWFYYINQNESEPINNNIIDSVEVADSNTISERPTSAPKSVENPALEDTVNPEYTTAQQAVLAEITPYEFSPDPYVEVRSLAWLLAVCMVENIINKINSNLDQLHPAQIKLQEETTQFCQQKRQRYPSLTSMTNESDFNGIFQPQSELGQMMASDTQNMSRKERLDNDKRILHAVINEQISPLIQGYALMHSWGGMELKELSLLLNTQDSSYVMKTSGQALNLLACEFDGGKSCQSTSTLMILNCSQHPEACGLDYYSWFQQTTLPGMRKDVELLITHYRQLN